MKIAIVGYDLEGKSSYQYFAAQGHEICIRDQNSSVSVPSGVPAVLGGDYLNGLDEFDLIVRTAGLHPAKILAKNPDVGAKITTQVNEFMQACPTTNIIGVTGTKGKGTTSTLIAQILQSDNKQVFIGGNIGVPPLSFISEVKRESWIVLELSSFQLTDLKISPHIAACLMMVPEHLNWHINMDEYISSKQQLFVHQKPDDIAIYFSKNKTSQHVAEVSPGLKIPYFEAPGAEVVNNYITIDGHKICSTHELKLIGKHNWENVCAAITATWQITHNLDAMRSVLKTFAGLPHRIELVREVNGIRYYNDSFASGLTATIAAMESIQGNKIVIIGGYDRGLNIDPFIEYCRNHRENFKHLLIIGQSATRLETALEEAGITNYTQAHDLKNMSDILNKANEIAVTGDSVILSPGFASFDMFKNFEDRGLKFKQAVSNL